MKIIILNTFVLCMSLMIYGAVDGQQGATTSDVSITSMTITAAGAVKKTQAVTNNANTTNRPVTLETADNVLKCSITVHNTTGQTRLTTLVVTMPVDITIVDNPNNGVVTKTGDQNRWGMPGFLVFDLFNMSPGTDITIAFTFTKSVQANKLGAYVYSASPDPEPANNFKSTSY